jgi:rhodanese-related sulfurtransferase
MKEISVEELRTRLAKKDPLVLVDVRQPDEFAESHIAGAKLIPLGELPERVGELDKSAEIVVNCRGGARSARAVQFLMSQGFVNVSNLIGGNDRWQAVASPTRPV